MRKLLAPLVVVVIVFISCNQEIDHPVAAYTWPVVYSLLDFEDSVHYVRLGKTFSGKDVDAMIHNSDSLYFKEAMVYFDIDVGDVEKKTIQLIQDDDLQRDPGTLPPTPFRVYKTTEKLNPGPIVLRIEIPEIEQYVQATIYVRGKPAFSSPNPESQKDLDFYEPHAVQIQWNGCELAQETIVRMWYLEITDDYKDTCHLDWLRVECDFTLEPNPWFELMKHSIKDDPRVKARILLSVDFLASGGNSQYCQYLKEKDFVFDLVSQPYSNLTGAYGFVGSRTKGGIYGYMPDREFLDSLSYLPSMEHLKFVHY